MFTDDSKTDTDDQKKTQALAEESETKSKTKKKSKKTKSKKKVKAKAEAEEAVDNSESVSATGSNIIPYIYDEKHVSSKISAAEKEAMNGVLELNVFDEPMDHF